jgi:hypothetical protein
VTLWVVHAHAHDAPQVSPILAIESPVKRCGKSTLLSVIQALVPRPLPAASVTSAVIFRVIDTRLPTLLVDEADAFIAGNEELRGILNSSHFRPMARVWRCIGEKREPQCFSTWAPIAIALIGELPGTLQDRSVVIRMRRKMPGETAERLRLDRMEEFDSLRTVVSDWAEQNIERLRQADPIVPELNDDRATDNWRPLIAIAEAAGGHWPDFARKAAKIVTGGRAGDDLPDGQRLLLDIKEVFRQMGAVELQSKVLCDYLCHLIDESPWAEYRHGKPLAPSTMGSLLKDFGVRAEKAPTGGRMVYRIEAFEDAWRRYSQ